MQHDEETRSYAHYSDEGKCLHNIHVDSYKRNVLLNEIVSCVCGNIAYDVNNDEMARVGDFLDSSEEVRHLSVALDDKQRGTDCKHKLYQPPFLFDMSYK